MTQPTPIDPARQTRTSRNRVKTAAHHRDRTIEILTALTDKQLTEWERRGQYANLPDGHKQRTLSDGMPIGISPYVGVEGSVDRLAFPGTDGVPLATPDLTGRSIGDLFAAIDNAYQAASRCENAVNDIRRHSNTPRQSVTAGPCQCCHRDVAGTEIDRLRAGYCMACHRAWLRAERPDRHRFELDRRADLDREDEESA